MKRIAITGIGVVSPLGNTATELFANLEAARSGIHRLEGDFFERLKSPLGATASLDAAKIFPAAKLRMLDRTSQFALYAAAQAIEDAGLTFNPQNQSRSGAFIGTGMGGIQSIDEAYQILYGEQSDRIKPFSILMSMYNAAASWIGIEYGLTGPNLTYSTACSSSAVAIGEAGRRISSGEADIMIAGGTEAPLTFGALKAWEALRTLATEDPADPSASCKPFSANRTGMVLGEGAAIVILEEWDHALSRGATIHAELVGYGLSTDATHITRPTIEGQANAMRLALASAELEPTAIDYINAHGTGTSANDHVETAAIKSVFQRHAYKVPVSSTKSMHGHLLGAAGALEFIISILAMQHSVIPPTRNLQVVDPECDLDFVPEEARRGVEIQAAMSSSFAFGGTNAVLISANHKY